ncbi:MAG: helix-turn-helix domain-containing protein [Anaeromassilibacillus sp.]
MLAQAVHFSPRECERTFEQLLHTTPQSYLQRRILAAMDLLTHGELPVIEIAARCGFSSHSYFSSSSAPQRVHPRGYRAKTQGA